MPEFIPTEFLNWAFRLLLAQCVIVVFLLMNIVSLSFPHSADFKPFFLLMAVYYWAIYRPTVMPLFYTFLLGVIVDLLSDVPVGLNALILVAIQLIVRRSRLFLMGQPYMTVWIGFAVIAFCYASALWLVVSVQAIDLFRPLPFTPAMIAMFLSILFFPLASLLLQGVHKLLPVASRPLKTVR
jgi:rod shape-determining protein MreD